MIENLTFDEVVEYTGRRVKSSSRIQENSIVLIVTECDINKAYWAFVQDVSRVGIGWNLRLKVLTMPTKDYIYTNLTEDQMNGKREINESGGRTLIRPVDVTPDDFTVLDFKIDKTFYVSCVSQTLQ